MSKLLTEIQVAKILQVKPKTVAKWRREGRLPEPVVITPKVIRFRSDDIAALIDGGAHAAR
ncbi:MAG: helix-turn-helix transcriptional regulator [Blastocatellia bacterium]